MPQIRIFNSLTRKKEVLRPLADKKLGMYVCGPTVYGPSHLGHARTYITFDFIHRFLESAGFKIKLVMNITDIHDDIIKEAKRQGVRAVVLAKKYKAEFLKDLEALRIKKPNVMPEVSAHIQEIKALISKLLRKSFAYETNDGVYFAISKFKDYGKLSGIKIKKAKTGTRVKTDKYEKNQVFDFALWKKEKEGEIFQSPWGQGRPGWHIECSAMSMKYLGKIFDIHGGGKDLLFPHHENEIAQSRAATSKKLFARYWLHTGTLMVRGKKMSKSFGNFILVEDILKKYQPRVLRFFVLHSLWRKPLDFNFKKLNEAKTILARIDNFVLKMREKNGRGVNPKIGRLISAAKNKIIKALSDDFNTPKAIGALLNFVKEINKFENKIAAKDSKKILTLLTNLDKFFLWLFPWQSGKVVPKEIMGLVKIREDLRKSGDFKKADEIRLKLKDLGYKIEDTPRGPRIISN